MAAALHHGLRLSKEEREERMHAMKTMVERDNLNSWWDYFAAITDQLSAGSSEVVQLNTKSKRQPVAIRIGA
jgi:trehalose-6-phosphate synthase